MALFQTPFNAFQALRMKNIFGPQEQTPELPNIPIQSGLPTQQPAIDINARMKELYTPETQASDKFNQMLSQYPQREQNPGMLKNIARAVLGGLQGPEAATNLIERPYQLATQDWKNQIVPAQSAAQLERQTNMNERQMAYGTINQEIANRRLDETTKSNERNIKIREDRARVYDYKARNPGMKFDFSGPKVLMADPATGKVTNTGIDTGNLSDEDKLDLQQSNSMKQIGARGAVQGALEETRQTGRETLQDQRAWNVVNIPDPNDPSKQIAVKMNSITGETKPIQMGDQSVGPVSRGATGGRPELPTQTRVREFNAARELYNTNPELRRFIKINSQNNTFEITEPSAPTSFAGYEISKGGPTPQQFEQIKQAIYGGGQPTFQTSGPGGGRGGGSGKGNAPQPRFTDQSPPPAPQGYKYVRKPGGGWTAVPIGQQ